jgi:hypothetical protein
MRATIALYTCRCTGPGEGGRGEEQTSHSRSSASIPPSRHDDRCAPPLDRPETSSSHESVTIGAADKFERHRTMVHLRTERKRRSAACGSSSGGPAAIPGSGVRSEIPQAHPTYQTRPKRALAQPGSQWHPIVAPEQTLALPLVLTAAPTTHGVCGGTRDRGSLHLFGRAPPVLSRQTAELQITVSANPEVSTKALPPVVQLFTRRIPQYRDRGKEDNRESLYSPSLPLGDAAPDDQRRRPANLWIRLPCGGTTDKLAFAEGRPGPPRTSPVRSPNRDRHGPICRRER